MTFSPELEARFNKLLKSYPPGRQRSALVPMLLRTQHADDPAVRSLPVVFTIHNIGYQGLFK